MDDKTLAKICIVITIIGMLALAVTYKPEFERKTIGEIIEKENSKGLVFAKIEYVIKSAPTTLLIVTDGNKATVFYSKQTSFAKDDFVWIYAERKEYEDKNELYAYKMVKDT